MNNRGITYRIFVLLFIAYFAVYGISPVIARIAPTAGHHASLLMLDRVIQVFADRDTAKMDLSGDTDDYVLVKKLRAVNSKNSLIDPRCIEKGRTDHLDYLFSSFQAIEILSPQQHSPNPVDGFESAHSGLSPPAV